MKKLLYFNILLAFFILGVGCKKRQEPKPDPCLAIKPVSADFIISEAPPFGEEFWTDNDTDTVGTYNVKFTALCEYCEYEWTLGSETFTTKSFVRNNFPPNTPIQVSLKVKGKNLPTNYFNCVKDGKVEDEKSRNFVHIILKDFKFLGKYTGTDTNRPNEPYTIEAYKISFPNGAEYFYVKGLIKPDCNCEVFNGIISGFQQSLVSLNCLGDCMAPIMVFNFDNNEEVMITYHTRIIENNKEVITGTKTFKGKRIL